MVDSGERAVESILFAEIGDLWTHTILIDQIANEYRFVAHSESPSTLEPPRGTVMTGLTSAVQTVEGIAGRTLMEEASSAQQRSIISPERLDGAGVDIFAATTSAAAPLTIAILSTDRNGADLVTRAARRLNSRISGIYTADTPAGRWSETGIAGAIEAIVSERPDVIVAVAPPGVESTDDALVEMLNGIQTLNDVYDVRARPPTLMVTAGNVVAASREMLRDGDVIDTIVLDSDASPEAAQSLVGQTLTDFYHDNVLARLPGFGALQSWSTLPIWSTMRAQARAVELLAQQTGSRILFVHVGAESSHLVVAGNGLFYTEARPGIGMGYTLRTFLESEGAEPICAWMPGLTPERDLHAMLLHRSLYPRIQPATRDALWLEQALTRVLLQRLTREILAELPESFRGDDGGPEFDYIIASGVPFRTAPEPAQAVLMLLDAIQPVGVTHLLRDRIGLLPVAGLLADTEPGVVEALLSRQLLESLGTVIIPSGDARHGSAILDFRMDLPDGGFYDVSVDAGDVYREYLPPDTSLELELTPARGINVGLGAGRRARVTVSGGTAGLFIDARGRPIPQKDELVEQRRQMHEWVLYVGG